MSDVPSTSGWLRPEARRVVRQARGEGTVTIIFTWVIRALVSIWNARYPLIWMLPAAMAGLWLPFSVAIPLFENESEASRVLGIILTTVGAILALSIAVIVLTAQVYASSRHAQYGGSLSDFARHVGILRVLSLGVAVLVTCGAALIGIGNGAPGAWAATWSVSLAGIFLVVIPGLFWLLLRAVDPEGLERHRFDLIDDLVGSESDRAAMNAVTQSYLEALCKDMGIRLQAIRIGEVPENRTVMVASRAGVFSDVHVGRFRRLVRDSAESGASLTLHAGVRNPVREGDPLLVTDQPVEVAAPRLKVFRISPDTDHRYLHVSEILHEEALDAIRSGRPTWYASVAEAYRELMLGPARHLADGGFHPNIAGLAQGFLSMRSPVEHMSSNLYQEIRLAIDSGFQEVALDVFYLPKRLAQDAAALDATRVIQQTLRLYPAAYHSLLKRPRSPDRDTLRDRTWRHLVEFEDFPVSREIENASTNDELDIQLRAIELGDYQLTELLKAAVEASDSALLETCLRRWSEVLRHWEPAHSRPHSWEVEHMRTSGAPEEDILQAEAQAEFNKYAAQAKEKLTLRRSTYIFGLAMWSLRFARQGVDFEPHASIFADLIERIDSLDDLLLAGGDAIASGNYELFANWIMFEQPELVIHTGGASSDLLVTLITALARFDSADTAMDIPPLEWLPPRIEGITRLIGDLEGETDLWEALEVEDPHATLERVKTALKRSVEAQQEINDDRIRSIEVSQDVKSVVRDHVVHGWTESELMVSLYSTFGTVRKGDEEETLVERYAYGWVEKTLLETADGVESYSEGLGHRLSRGEVAEFLDSLESSPTVQAGPNAVEAELHNQLEELRQCGYQPSVILLPSDWRLHRKLGLDPLEVRRTGSEYPLTSRSVGRYLGQIDGVDALASGEVKGRLVLADLAALADWVIPGEEPETAVDVAVEEFDHESALQLAQKQLTGQEAEVKALETMKMALITASERFLVKITDSEAARVVAYEETDQDTEA